NDLFQFTELVNDHYTYEQKCSLVENLWQVAFADGRLDKYEEQFIRKVAGLLHLAHSDFMKAKHTAKEKMEG
ncbi:MAG: TerB family tellurite resistance protein, partial [Pseudomonadales bacterium]|nr:TerB family tellurite resistance protein [Pseudomonadales bacterium]